MFISGLALNALSLHIKTKYIRVLGKKKKYSSFKSAKTRERERAKEAGFYDGRFREKAIKLPIAYRRKHKHPKKYYEDEIYF